MIHLEDYLDTLEALPMELQRQFTLMRELDALSQDIQDQMKQATEEFISNPPTKDDPRHAEYLRNFVQLFSTVLKHGEEKVALATQTYDLVDKHIRRLDDDLGKFEERQLSMPPRIPHAWGAQTAAQGTREGTEEAAGRRRQEEGGGKKRRNQRDASPAATAAAVQKSGTPGGRRGNGARGGSSQALAGGSTAAASAASAAKTNGQAESSRARGAASKVSAQDFSEMPIDPNEPRYCYCRQVSYGEMVACDDENCEIEWFHLGCVDLKAPPKGQWFCRDCSQKHKRRHA